MVAIAILLVVITLTLIVIRVGTIALTATGLSVEVAHFQSRSALTGVGFTESELIVNHPVRHTSGSELLADPRRERLGAARKLVQNS